MAGNGGWKKLIQKLREKEKSFPLADANMLAHALAHLGKEYPREGGLFSSFQSTFSQASILIYQLLRTLSPETRLQTAKELLGPDTPLLFAEDCFRWFRHSKEEANNLFSTQEADELGRLLVARLRDSDGKKSLFEEYGEDAPMMYYIWQTWGSKDEVKFSIEKRLAAEPKQADVFLEIFSPTAYPAATGIPYKSDIERAQYDQIAGYIDPSVLLECLKKSHSSDLKSTDYPRVFEDKDKRNLWALQFAWIHNHVLNEREAKTQKDKQK